LPAFKGETIDRKKPIFWQYGDGGGVRDGKMKAVFYDKTWELHDMSQNRNETDDLSQKKPELLNSMIKQWQKWYDSTGAAKSGKSKKTKRSRKKKKK